MKKQKYIINIEIVQTAIEKRTGKRPQKKEIAEKIGVSAQSVSNWRHISVPPIIETLVKLSKLSGLSINEFITRKNGKF